MKKKRGLSSLYLALVLIFLYLPILIVILYSFNANSARIPISFTGWTGGWYRKLFTGRNHYGDGLLLSLRVAFWSVLLSVVIGTFGAVGMSQLENGKPTALSKAIRSMVTLPIMIPEIILGLCFMVMLNLMDVKGDDIRLILAHTTFCIPYVFLNVKSRLVGMDESLYDAARDLGASAPRILFDITLPLCAPAIVSGAVLALAMSLDDFVISFFVYTNTEGTLPIMIYSSVKTGVSPQVNALCTLLMGAVFLIVFLFRILSASPKGKKEVSQ